jgi:hypothetical protein
MELVGSTNSCIILGAPRSENSLIIIDSLQEHALKSSTDKDGKACVVCKCPMVHEAEAFQINLKHTWDAAEQLSHLARRVPIHVVFGESMDLM